MFLEVPVADDVWTCGAPDGVEVHWLPRDGGAAGRGDPRRRARRTSGEEAATPVRRRGVDPDLWETPTYSSSGEDVDAAVRVVGHDFDDLYAWIAGESSLVTGLRRALVKDLGIDRHQVAFMGYWRLGVSMRS